MTQGTALLLVDLQQDFLTRPGLIPDPESLCGRAAALLAGARRRGIPVVHVHTLVGADGAGQMPHWTRQNRRQCVEGTPGAEPPPGVAPLDHELVVRKRYFTAFADQQLDTWLRGRGVQRLIVAGAYLHACVRSTVLDAYERGYEVWVADDAVGTTEPVHAEITRDYLAARAASFRRTDDILAALDGERGRAVCAADAAAVLPVAVIDGAPRARPAAPRLAHRNPCRTDELLAEVPLGSAEEVADAAHAAARAGRAWARERAAARADRLQRWATELDARRGAFAELIVREQGKPRRFADEEIGRAVAHARVAAELANDSAPLRIAAGVSAAQRPLGVVGLVTPWNNPLAIPVGKIAPALAFGNTVVLKPAPQASATALAILDSLAAAGFPPGVVNAVLGDAEAARALCREPRVAAVSVTGSLVTGRVLAALCAASLKPFQAELGGNNAAIVLGDADLESDVPTLMRAAFGFAGQRCTAIRRFVVERPIAARFESLARRATEALVNGASGDPSTEVGPLISIEKRDRVAAAIERAVAGGARLVTGGFVPPDLTHGAWLAPTLLADIDPRDAVAQVETFGPLAVILTANDLDHALEVANGVEQGLVLSVHSRDEAQRARVLDAAQAGIVQLRPGPLAVHPRAPFLGWKASGVGPPEHGVWDAAFYTRAQAVYGDESC